MTTNNIRIKVTARALISNKTHLLMTWLPREHFFCLPGGGLEVGESLKACLKRELQEELGLYAEPEQLVECLEEHYTDRGHPYQEFFLFRVEGLTSLLEQAPISNEPQLQFRVVPIAEISNLPVLPRGLTKFMKDYQQQLGYICMMQDGTICS